MTLGTRHLRIKKYVIYFNFRYKGGYIIGEIRLLSKNTDGAHLSISPTVSYQKAVCRGQVELGRERQEGGYVTRLMQGTT